MKKINLKNVRIEVRLIFVKLLITICLLKEIPSRGLKLESDHLTFEDCSIGEKRTDADGNISEEVLTLR